METTIAPTTATFSSWGEVPRKECGVASPWKTPQGGGDTYTRVDMPRAGEEDGTAEERRQTPGEAGAITREIEKEAPEVTGINDWEETTD